GVNEYSSSALTELRYAGRDAEVLAAALLREEVGFDSVRVLSTARGQQKAGDRPTGANIRAALKALLAKRTRGDVVLVGLAGHGLQLTARGRKASYFRPSDAQVNAPRTLLELTPLFRDLDGCGAGVKVLLIDACRNTPSGMRSIDLDALPRAS